MSAMALNAIYRLKIIPNIDGTAQLLLLYLALRHSDKHGGAWPGLRKICSDLNMHRGRVVDALKRLTKAGLVISQKRLGPNGSTFYTLPWILPSQQDPNSNSPIKWERSDRSVGSDRSGQPDRSAQPTVGATSETGLVDSVKSVGAAGTKNSKYKTALDVAFEEAMEKQNVRNRRA